MSQFAEQLIDQYLVEAGGKVGVGPAFGWDDEPGWMVMIGTPASTDIKKLHKAVQSAFPKTGGTFGSARKKYKGLRVLEIGSPSDDDSDAAGKKFRQKVMSVINSAGYTAGPASYLIGGDFDRKVM